MRNLCLGLSLLLYGIALFLPAYYAVDSTTQGYGALLFGPFGFLGGVDPYIAVLSWLANPCILFCLLSGRWPNLQRGLALCSGLFALLFLSINSIIVNSAGSSASVTGFGPGYIFWGSSIFMLNLWSWMPKDSPADS